MKFLFSKFNSGDNFSRRRLLVKNKKSEAKDTLTAENTTSDAICENEKSSNTLENIAAITTYEGNPGGCAMPKNFVTKENSPASENPKLLKFAFDNININGRMKDKINRTLFFIFFFMN